ncbi:MAG: Gfo/Idh/MocA family oxidoreductase [Candidatus Omnitrophica bacterium]|nr:Gfo/Idh/MocA family oxidoreductase [Candidatus Omnitrophota bacterium]
MTKVRFAIIGCGRICYRHIEAIQANARAELVALCDLNLERARERAEGLTVKLYQNYHEMLEREDIDVVCIMTPSGMHPEHAVDILEKYQKHLVIEKPMALRVEDGERLIRAAHEHGVRLFVVHQNRFNKAITKIKSAVDEGILGRITMGTVRLRWSRGQAYYDRDPWRGTWALDGGALTNQTIHHIDLLQWLCGEVESVSAVAKTQLVDVEVEDSAVAWIRFKNGALGTIEATTAVRPPNKDLEASISLLGEHGTVIVEGAAVNKLTTWTVNAEDISEYAEEPPNVYGFGHNIIINNVVESLLDNAQPLVSGEEALSSIQLLNAIYRSIELDGKEVYLKDNPRSQKFGVLDAKSQKIADLYRTDIVLGSKKS